MKHEEEKSEKAIATTRGGGFGKHIEPLNCPKKLIEAIPTLFRSNWKKEAKAKRKQLQGLAWQEVHQAGQGILSGP